MFCPARFGVLFCSVVLGCLYTPQTVRGAVTGDVFECDIAHRRSGTVFCMLYEIKCNPLQPIYAKVLYLSRMCREISVPVNLSF